MNTSDYAAQLSLRRQQLESAKRQIENSQLQAPQLTQSQLRGANLAKMANIKRQYFTQGQEFKREKEKKLIELRAEFEKQKTLESEFAAVQEAEKQIQEEKDAYETARKFASKGLFPFGEGKKVRDYYVRLAKSYKAGQEYEKNLLEANKAAKEKRESLTQPEELKPFIAPVTSPQPTPSKERLGFAEDVKQNFLAPMQPFFKDVGGKLSEFRDLVYPQKAQNATIQFLGSTEEKIAESIQKVAFPKASSEVILEKNQERLNKELENFERQVKNFNEKYRNKTLPESEYNKAVELQQRLETQQKSLISRSESLQRESAKVSKERELNPGSLTSSFASSFITAPVSLTRLGAELITSPTTTAKKEIKNIVNLPSQVILKPLSTTGALLGQAASFEVLGRAVPVKFDTRYVAEDLGTAPSGDIFFKSVAVTRRKTPFSEKYYVSGGISQLRTGEIIGENVQPYIAAGIAVTREFEGFGLTGKPKFSEPKGSGYAEIGEMTPKELNVLMGRNPILEIRKPIEEGFSFESVGKTKQLGKDKTDYYASKGFGGAIDDIKGFVAGKSVSIIDKKITGKNPDVFLGVVKRNKLSDIDYFGVSGIQKAKITASESFIQAKTEQAIKKSIKSIKKDKTGILSIVSLPLMEKSVYEGLNLYERTETVTIPKQNILGLTENQDLRFIEILGTGQKSDQVSKEIFAFRPSLKFVQKGNQNLRPFEVFRFGQGQTQGQVSQTVQRQGSRTRGQVSSFVPYNLQLQKNIKFLKSQEEPTLAKRPKKKRFLNLFIPELRRRKKFRPLSSPSSLEFAVAAARSAALRGLGVSVRFKEAETGRIIEPDFNSPFFEKSKREKGVFLQKPKFRLSSRGERQEIQAARQAKRNLFFKKQKRRGQ